MKMLKAQKEQFKKIHKIFHKLLRATHQDDRAAYELELMNLWEVLIND